MTIKRHNCRIKAHRTPRNPIDEGSRPGAARSPRAPCPGPANHRNPACWSQSRTTRRSARPVLTSVFAMRLAATLPRMKHVDVLIVGAGISGIGMACHLKRQCPDRSFVLLEGRDAIGGTWDLFRYPGIRSDSDMYTFGYAFKPWNAPREIAPAEDIRAYLDETVAEYGLADHIRFNCAVSRLEWSSAKRLWTASCTDKQSGNAVSITSNFVVNCTGYYRYDQAYQPELPGQDQFAGPIIHPQFWPEDLDYSGKRVVVVGSGATAVTLVPAIAKDAEHVTMLQRTPSFVVTRPEQDPLVTRLKGRLPDRLVWRIKRTKNLLLGALVYFRCQRNPEKVRQFLIDLANQQLGDAVDASVHFNAPYKPWEQRLCLVPNGDLFRALRSGDADVVTDHVAGFAHDAVILKSGKQLPADLVVSATGLKLRFLGGIETFVDGNKVQTGDLVNYRGTLFGGIPNFASIFGYANASWTLKADLSANYICRLLNHMRRRKLSVATPVLPARTMTKRPLLNLSSGYVKRAIQDFPQSGDRGPWQNFNYYLLDFLATRLGRINNAALQLR